MEEQRIQHSQKPVTQVLYMRVTKDKYELPLNVCASVRELARQTGRKESSIFTFLSKNKPGWKRVEIELDEEEEI